MKKNSQYIPRWLLWPNELDPPDANLLRESREEMYEALSLFHNHVRYVIYIMVSMPAVILLVMRLWPSAEPTLASYLIAAIVVIGVPFVGIISIRIIRRYYEVYVSALVFATRAHIAAGYTQVHPWLERTIKQAQDWIYVDNCLKFLDVRAKSGKDTFAHYRRIIIVLSAVSFACGIVFLYFGLN